jgi:hypothetical protein
MTAWGGAVVLHCVQNDGVGRGVVLLRSEGRRGAGRCSSAFRRTAWGGPYEARLDGLVDLEGVDAVGQVGFGGVQGCGAGG